MAGKIFQKKVLLSNYTTYKIGGPAKYFFNAETKEEIIKAIKFARTKKIKFFILGGGSNVLFSDKGYNGLIIQIRNSKFEIRNSQLRCDAGLSLAKLASSSAKSGFTGFEWAAGIPKATVGGAIFGHAQAFGEKISDRLEYVEVLDLKTLKIKNLSKEQCKFSLKNSIFKKRNNFIILSAVFNLPQKTKAEIEKKTQEFLNYRNKNHPISMPSAGSVFVNPVNMHSGELIEKSGLKGKRIGNAQISEQHANFIVNFGNASSKDVQALIKLAQKEVKKKFNILLETEIRIIK